LNIVNVLKKIGNVIYTMKEKIMDKVNVFLKVIMNIYQDMKLLNNVIITIT